MTRLPPIAIADDVLAAWGFLPAAVRPITVGLINQTYRVRRGDAEFILQRLNAIFSPEVNRDIDAITAHLARTGLSTPRLQPTLRQELWHTDSDGHCWRALTYVAGTTYESFSSPQQSFAAGALVGRFHSALQHFSYEFQHTRPAVHDTPKHLQALRLALRHHPNHQAFAQLLPLAEEILQRASALPSLTHLPTTIVHGDPKITNILFAAADTALCLVDLDTMAHMPVALELGDALRSWCNRSTEDSARARFDRDFCAAAIAGYAAEAPALLPPGETLAAAVQTICLELGARFAADTLNESYFGWDNQRFEGAWQHNLQRTQAQLALAKDAAAQHADIVRAVQGLGHA